MVRVGMLLPYGNDDDDDLCHTCCTCCTHEALTRHGGGVLLCTLCEEEVTCFTKHANRTQESGSDANPNPHRTRHGKQRVGCGEWRCRGGEQWLNVSCLTEHGARSHIPHEQMDFGQLLAGALVTA